MPRHLAPKKDVISCDKLRLAANKLLPADLRMRELDCRKSDVPGNGSHKLVNS